MVPSWYELKRYPHLQIPKNQRAILAALKDMSLREDHPNALWVKGSSIAAVCIDEQVHGDWFRKRQKIILNVPIDSYRLTHFNEAESGDIVRITYRNTTIGYLMYDGYYKSLRRTMLRQPSS